MARGFSVPRAVIAGAALDRALNVDNRHVGYDAAGSVKWPGP